ncbi:hypothetical protein RJT34_12251 [Clitoria ternatea]|uniref:Uncharacterized protein n=1 Tax=Clitoria ternatea TaxID=43366 RepID=A0AAN9JLS7_CLITE
MKQLPLDRYFDINNVKRIVLEADGYQPYLISPGKGLRSLIKGVLELAKEPSRLCVEEYFIIEAKQDANKRKQSTKPLKRISTRILSNFVSLPSVKPFSGTISYIYNQNSTILTAVVFGNGYGHASYGAYAGYGGNYANSQLPTSVPQSTAYGAYPPAYPVQIFIE